MLDSCCLHNVGMDLQVQDPGRPAKGIVQVVKDIMVEDGVGGFFKGWWAQIVALGSSNFVYFYASCMIKVIVTARYVRILVLLLSMRVLCWRNSTFSCPYTDKAAGRWDQ